MTTTITTTTDQPDSPRRAEQRYWRVIAGMMAAVALATVLVVVRGNTVRIPVSASPVSGEVVSGRARVVLSFPTAMRPESVETRFALDPPVTGKWSWEANGARSERVAQFIPTRPLTPGQTYRAMLTAGAQATNGRTVERATVWQFAVRQPTLLMVRPTGQSGVPQLWSARADGSDARQITRETGGVRDYSPAPDGSRIAYTTPEGKTTALWVIGADGTGRTRLSGAGDPSGYASPAWSPASDVIVYVLRSVVPPGGVPGATPVPAPSTSGNAATLGTSKLWIVTPQGQQLGRLYGRGDEIGFDPVWSPDGTRLAFREQVNAQNVGAVVLFDLSPDPVKIPAGPGSVIAWSPDGTHAAYDESLPDMSGTIRSHIVIVAADGSNPAPLPGGTDRDASPAWSPDGTRLAFTRRTEAATGIVTDIWVSASDGSGAAQLLGGDGQTSSDPAWSPDGQLLVATRFALVGTGGRGLWIVRADGSGARLLLADAERAIWIP